MRNTIMIIRKLLLTAASIAAICPAVSHAFPENTALNACAQAFATSLASGSAAPAFKLKYHHSESAGPLADYYSSREFTFYLQARDPKTGLTVARATCSADTRGTVIALTATPAETSPSLAAQL
jgi:hypothetical protein